jgi:hypothetical protein
VSGPIEDAETLFQNTLLLSCSHCYQDPLTTQERFFKKQRLSFDRVLHCQDAALADPLDPRG